MTDNLLDHTRTFPLFAAPSPDRLSFWYQDHLGFPNRRSFGDDYAIVRRDAVEIHFWPCGERKIAENTSAYFEIKTIKALNTLHAEWKSAAERDGFHPGRISTAPIDHDHGMREFYVWDPAGNLLRFGANLPTEKG